MFMPKTAAPSLAVLAAAVRDSITRFNRRMRRERPATTMTLSQTSALSVLVTTGPMTPSQLASAERVKPPTITRIIGALQRHGLISRVPHPTDRRQVLVAATPAGTQFIAENRRAREAWLMRELGQLSSEQRAVVSQAAQIFANLAAR